MQHYMIVTTMNNHNDILKELYDKNYSHDKEFTPEYRYVVSLEKRVFPR